jgi:hypothetical protein
MRTFDQIRAFASSLLREPLWHCGHPDAWGRVVQAADREQMITALGYCAGYADASRAATVLGEPLYYAADTLGLAARTFLLAITTEPSIDVRACAATYRAELHDVMRRVAA